MPPPGSTAAHGLLRALTAHSLSLKIKPSRTPRKPTSARLGLFLLRKKSIGTAKKLLAPFRRKVGISLFRTRSVENPASVNLTALSTSSGPPAPTLIQL